MHLPIVFVETGDLAQPTAHCRFAPRRITDSPRPCCESGCVVRADSVVGRSALSTPEDLQPIRCQRTMVASLTLTTAVRQSNNLVNRARLTKVVRSTCRGLIPRS